MAHPVLLVGVVAGEVVDFFDAVGVDDVLHEGGGEQGAGRVRGETGVVGELEDQCAAIFDEPELGGGGFAVDAQHAEAQPAVSCGHGAQFGDEARVRLWLLPAGAVAGFESGDGVVEIGPRRLMHGDVEGLRLLQLAPMAFDGVAHAGGEPSVVGGEVAPGDGQVPVAEAEVAVGAIALCAQGLFDVSGEGGIGIERVEVDGAPALGRVPQVLSCRGEGRRRCGVAIHGAVKAAVVVGAGGESVALVEQGQTGGMIGGAQGEEIQAAISLHTPVGEGFEPVQRLEDIRARRSYCQSRQCGAQGGEILENRRRRRGRHDGGVK